MKAFSGIMLILLSIGLLMSTVNVYASKAKEVVYVKADAASGAWIGTDWNKTYVRVDFETVTQMAKAKRHLRCHYCLHNLQSKIPINTYFHFPLLC